MVAALQPLVGRRLGGARVLRGDVVHGEPVEFNKFARGRKIRAIRRQAKRIIFDIGGDRRIQFHLGMTGRLTVCERSRPLLPHTHLRIGIAGSKDELRFHDVRRFGGVWLLNGAGDTQQGAAGFSPRESSHRNDSSVCGTSRGLKPAAPWSGEGFSGIERSRGLKPAAPWNSQRGLGPLGPDALEITLPAFRGLLRRDRQIKALLLDQTAIGGLGNIYVDESLFKAKIHPLTKASALSDDQVQLLRRVMRNTLRAAIKAGGSTINDYRTPNGERGWFQFRHQVYGREGKPCKRCKTSIERIQAAGRSSHICPRCQRFREHK